MIQEDKELLLKDLCARLPYGVFVKEKNKIAPIKCDFECHPDLDDLENVKPYLRPISSMTEGEKDEFKEVLGKAIMSDAPVASYHGIDWLNKKMFDYRGLIPMGLAIEALKGMYNLK